jgi:hypothetical protein
MPHHPREVECLNSLIIEETSGQWYVPYYVLLRALRRVRDRHDSRHSPFEQV